MASFSTALPSPTRRGRPANRRAFEEVFQILRLAWKDDAFRFKGEFYQYPYPYTEGTPWPPTGWTTEFGDPHEVGKDGRLHAISVVPKPYQKPHPPLFQAFSVSEATIRWCAKEDIVPMILMSHPEVLRGLVSAYVDSAAQAGRKLERGKSVGVVGLFRTDEEIFGCRRPAPWDFSKRFSTCLGGFKSPESKRPACCRAMDDRSLAVPLRLRTPSPTYARAWIRSSRPETRDFAWLSDPEC
jgi:hypothetical protein